MSWCSFLKKRENSLGPKNCGAIFGRKILWKSASLENVCVLKILAFSYVISPPFVRCNYLSAKNSYVFCLCFVNRE